MRDNVATMSDSLAQKRFRDFVAEVERELGGAHGWRTSVAKRLGVSLPHLSRILAGKRRVGASTMQRAASEWGFSLEYFTAQSGSYRDFLTAEAGEAEKTAPSAPYWQQRKEDAVPRFAATTYRHLAPALVAIIGNLPSFMRMVQPDEHRALARAVLGLPLVKHAMAVAEYPETEEGLTVDEGFASHALALEDDVTALLAVLSRHVPPDENATKD